MKHLWCAAAVGLSLMAGPVQSQVRMDAAAAERLAERGLATSTAAQRVTALLGQTLADPSIAAATSPEGLAQAVETRAQLIADTRAELGRIAATLDALPRLPNPDDLDIVRSAEQDGRNTAELARRSDAILAAFQAVPQAVRARDQVRFNDAVSKISAGAVLMQQAQAAMMRAQAGLQDPTWPSHAQFMAMACLADGQGAMQSGMSNGQSRAEAAAKMDEAANCVRVQIERGRGLLAAADANPLRARLAPLDVELFEAMSDAVGCVSNARTAVAGNEGPAVIAGPFNACYGPVGTRINDLIIRQHQILADVS